MLKRILSTAGAALALAAPGLMACGKHCDTEGQCKATDKAPKGAVICPVMKGKVANPAKAAKSVYKGKTYWFCCPGCKPRFDANPAKYVGGKK